MRQDHGIQLLLEDTNFVGQLVRLRGWGVGSIDKFPNLRWRSFQSIRHMRNLTSGDSSVNRSWTWSQIPKSLHKQEKYSGSKTHQHHGNSGRDAPERADRRTTIAPMPYDDVAGDGHQKL